MYNYLLITKLNAIHIPKPLIKLSNYNLQNIEQDIKVISESINR